MGLRLTIICLERIADNTNEQSVQFNCIYLCIIAGITVDVSECYQT
jgi:hypothetical protein